MRAPIGVIAPMWVEMAPLRDQMEVWEASKGGGLLFFRGLLAGHEVVLICSGAGKVNAARATQFLVDRFSPSRLILCGVAGSLSEELGPGDVIVASEVLFHDVGMLLAGERFAPTGACFLNEEGEMRYRRRLQADQSLVATALREAEVKQGLPQVRSGSLVTGDQAIFCSRKRAWLRETFGALAVEMEGAAVGQVAIAQGLPFVVIRGISDPADETVGLDLSQLVRYADEGWDAEARRALRFASHILARPHRASRALHLWESLRLASQNAAKVTMALLEGLSES